VVSASIASSNDAIRLIPRGDDAELSGVATQRVGQLGTLTDQSLTHLQHHRLRLLSGDTVAHCWFYQGSLAVTGRDLRGQPRSFGDHRQVTITLCRRIQFAAGDGC
jgi:hypothetical protein